MKKTLYPGSFDPITYGHMDIISQALKIYDEVIVAVLVNSTKKSGMFTLNERVNLIKEIYKDTPNVKVISSAENIASVDIALNNECSTMVRGLRDLTDFADELKLAELNLTISDEKVNTVAFFANPTKTTISSTMVKELTRLHKNIDNFVHPIVKEAINKKTGKDD